MKLVHTDNNNVSVMTVETAANGTNISGHLYKVMMGDVELTEIQFQFGGVEKNGVNGVTSEALLAILIDRTDALNGQFPCEENEAAIKGMKEALASFNLRTSKRMMRGVEGKEIA